MAEKAQITSVEAIAAFRAKLVVYLAQTRSVMDEVSNEMSRARQWLQGEQRMFWEREMRVRARRLEEANQELFSARLSKIGESTALPLMAVQRAQRAVQEAEAKMRILKRWDNELENQASPLLKQTEQLQGFLAAEMVHAVAYLDQVLKALDAYRNVSATRGDGQTPAEPSKPEVAP